MERQLSYCLYAALLAVTWASAVWASDGTEVTRFLARCTAGKAWACLQTSPVARRLQFPPQHRGQRCRDVAEGIV